MTSTIADISSRLENVRVDVRADLEITRQIFSGQAVYVLRDPIHSQSFQLSAADYQLLVHIQSRSTLGEIFAALCQKGMLSDEDRDHFYQLILQFHQLGILSLPIADGKGLYRRNQKWQATQRRWSINKLLFCRIPVWRPDRFLERTNRLVRFMFSRAFLLGWVIAVLGCLTLIGLRWEEFKQPVGSMLALKNIAWVWCLLVGLKAIHELGHAYACKIYGGHVPEIGIFLILFTPCAYVDASSSWGFPKRRHRLIVGLAGMYFESLCAMVACVVWVFTAPGLLHSLAVYAITLSTAITIGFNANPLMRYDGYFILSDLINVPNLRSVSREYFWGWCKHIAYGVERPHVHYGKGMCLFLSVFGLASSVYTVSVLLTICYVLTFQLPSIGPWLGAMLLLSMSWNFLASKFQYLARSPELIGHRRRAVAVVGMLSIAALWLISWLPVQQELTLAGTVEWDRIMELRSPVDGYVRRVSTQRGARLEQGEVLIELDAPQLREELAQATAQVRALTVQLHHQLEHAPEKVALTQAELKLAQQRLDHARHRSSQAMIVAQQTGQLINDTSLPLAGARVAKGESLGKFGTGDWVVRLTLNDQEQSQCAPEVGDWMRFRTSREPDRDHWGRVARVVVRSDHAERLASSFAPRSSHKPPLRAASTELEFELTLQCLSAKEQELLHGESASVKLTSRRQTLGELLWLRSRQLWQEVLLQGA